MNFERLKPFIKHFWKLTQKKKRIFRKDAADVSVTSATRGYQAEDGPEVSLGRRWPSGLGPDSWWVTTQMNRAAQPIRQTIRSSKNTPKHPMRDADGPLGVSWA
jgi:hypothetical protein